MIRDRVLFALDRLLARAALSSLTFGFLFFILAVSPIRGNPVQETA